MEFQSSMFTPTPEQKQTKQKRKQKKKKNKPPPGSSLWENREDSLWEKKDEGESTIRSYPGQVGETEEIQHIKKRKKPPTQTQHIPITGGGWQRKQHPRGR
jgi:hypothetical protein